VADLGALDVYRKTVRKEMALTLLHASEHVLEEVDGDGVVGRQVGLCVNREEGVDLPLAFVLGRELAGGDLLHDFGF
jgi:hypothetical protein